MSTSATLFEGQLCQRCKKPVGRHKFTGLGAIICMDLSANSGLTPWYAHKFVTLDGKPYMSIMEQIGALAGLLEERGLPDAYEPVMAGIQHLVSRLANRLPQDVKPHKDWFKNHQEKQIDEKAS
jgi:hypothetical protein